MRENTIPEDWELAEILPLYKKGERLTITKVTLLRTSRKNYEYNLTKRLKSELKTVLEVEQNSFKMVR